MFQIRHCRGPQTHVCSCTHAHTRAHTHTHTHTRLCLWLLPVSFLYLVPSLSFPHLSTPSSAPFPSLSLLSLFLPSSSSFFFFLSLFLSLSLRSHLCPSPHCLLFGLAFFRRVHGLGLVKSHLNTIYSVPTLVLTPICKMDITVKPIQHPRKLRHRKSHSTNQQISTKFLQSTRHSSRK